VNAAPTITDPTLPNAIVGQPYSHTVGVSGGTGSLSWSVLGPLPVGLSIDSSTGTISGTPSAAGPSIFTLQVTDSALAYGLRTYVLPVLGGPTITTTSLSAITVGQSVAATLARTGGTDPVVWSISAGELPGGLSLNPATGEITGAPTTSGAASFTARALDVNSLEDTQALTWTVNPAPEITTTSLPPITVGASYAQTMSATGGTGGLTWSIAAGAPPAGLSLNPATGEITGTPTNDGTASFTVKVTDTNGVEATKALEIIVNPAPSVTTTSLPAAPVTVAFSQTLAASGGTGAYSWSVVSGVLPLGLGLNTATGAITGAPTTVGSYSFTVQVADSLGISATQALSIEVLSAPTITTTSLSAITVGQSVSAALTSTNGTAPFTWSISSGSLPAGLNLTAATGAITGTPTGSGDAMFTARIVDANALEDTQALSWTVNPAPEITTTSLPATTVGAAYSQTITAGGGTGALTWSILAGALPAGLSLNPSTGAVTGAATTPGAASFTAKVTDTNGVEATQALSISVNAAPSITTTSLEFGVTTLAYSQSLAASGGTGALTWSISAGALPPGLSLNTSTGEITGTPATVGMSFFTVTAADTLGIFALKPLTIETYDHPEITTTLLAPVTVGQNVTAAVAATHGTAPYSWAVTSGALPAGVSLNPATGALSGAPTSAGAASFTVQATDAHNLTDSQALAWIVNPAPEITTTSLPSTTVGAAYSQTLAASGGTGALTWSVSSGSLPAGLSLNPSTGGVTGTATTPGPSSFTAKVTDTNGVEATQALSILVNSAPSISTTSLPFGVTTLAYAQSLAAAGGTGALTWSVSSGALPPGLSLNTSTGAITGTPTTVGLAAFTVQAADTLGINATQALTIEIYDHPEITTNSLAPVTVGQPVTTSAVAMHGTTPYAWAVTSGALPAGVSLNPSTGALTGTPTAAGEASFTVQVTDAHSLTDSQALTWTVNPAPEVTTTSLPATTAGAAYSQTLAATGGTGALTWSISAGALPGGLSLNPSTGALTGTATTPGPAAFTAKATDTNGVEATRELSVLVNPAPSITTTSLPFGVTTLAYSQIIAATGGTGDLTWSVSSGALPAGLSLNPATGAITGTPTTVESASFTVQISDTLEITGAQALTIDVFDHPEITTTTLDPLTVGQNVSAAVTASNGTAPYTWSLDSGALPAGLTLAPSTGAITGTPTAEGSSSFTAKVTDAHDLSGTQALSWTVNPAPEITTSALPQTTVNRPVEALTLVATGGTGALQWGASGLPCSVDVDGSGSFSGVPFESGVFTVDITATDENGVQATKQLTFTVNVTPSVTTTSLPRGTAGAEFTQPLGSTGGTGDHTWSVTAGALPAGLALSPQGVISGIPTAAQISGFTVEITDQAGATATQALTLEIVDPLEITTTTLPEITVGQPINSTLTAAGGAPPLTWAVTAGSLPAGVALDAATGLLSGAATDAAAASFTVQVSDADGRTDTQVLSFGVNPPVQITTTALPPATVGGTYEATVAASGGTGAVTWSAAGLPADLTLDANSGALHGSFPTAGDIVIVCTATDANAEKDTASLTVVVSPELIILTDTVPMLERGTYDKVQFEASGGAAPLVWSGGAPDGMQMRADGALFGTPTAAGTFPVTIGVKDANGHYVERSYDIVVEEDIGFEVLPTLLTFEATEGGAAPAPRQVTVTSTPGNQSFTAQPDAAWVAVSPAQNTPAVLDVTVDPAGLAAGDYQATIDIPEAEQSVDVRLTVSPETDPTLTVTPGALTILAEPGGPAQSRLALVRTKGDPGLVSAVPDSDLPWLTVESRAAADTSELQAVLTLTADPSGVPEGSYEGLIQVTAGELSFDLPVQVDVAAAQFELSHSGLTFEGAAGGANPPAQRLRVLNMASSPLDWMAAVNTPWTSATPPAGNANPVSELDVSVDAAGLEAGLHTSLLTVASPGGEERTAEVLLSLTAGSVAPQVAPAGLLFHAVDGAAPPAQQLTLSFGGDAPLAFVHAVAPAEAAAWLSVTPSSGAVPAGGALALDVHAQPAGLTPGAHQASLSLEFADGSIRVVKVSLLVTAGACEPTRLEPLYTRLGDHFQARQGFPSAVELLVADDCGNLVSEGAGVLELSAPGEPALPLLPGPAGLWTATWTPSDAHASVTATAIVESAAGLHGAVQATGVVE
jgi:hypothetical protein